MKKLNGSPVKDLLLKAGEPVHFGAAVPSLSEVSIGGAAATYDCPGYVPEMGVVTSCPKMMGLGIRCPTCNDTGKTTAAKLRALGERFRGAIRP